MELHEFSNYFKDDLFFAINIDPVAIARPRLAIKKYEQTIGDKIILDAKPVIYNTNRTTKFKNLLIQELYVDLLQNPYKKHQIKKIYDEAVEMVIIFLIHVKKSVKNKENLYGKYHTYKPDLDNLAKGVKDVCTKLEIYKDDSQVSKLTLIKKWTQDPMIFIGLKKL